MYDGLRLKAKLRTSLSHINKKMRRSEYSGAGFYGRKDEKRKKKVRVHTQKNLSKRIKEHKKRKKKCLVLMIYECELVMQ